MSKYNKLIAAALGTAAVAGSTFGLSPEDINPWLTLAGSMAGAIGVFAAPNR